MLIDPHVGGVIVRLKQDPGTGEIAECTPTILRYHCRGRANGRSSHSGPAVHPERR